MTFELGTQIILWLAIALFFGLGVFSICALILGARADEAMEKWRND